MNHESLLQFSFKIQRSIYDVSSKGMGPSSEIGPFAKTFNEHCLANRVCPLVSKFQIKKKLNFEIGPFALSTTPVL